MVAPEPLVSSMTFSMAASAPGEPSVPTTIAFMRGLYAPRLEDLDLRRVSDHESVGARLAGTAADVHVASEQRRLHAPVEPAHRRALEQDRVLDLGRLHDAVAADRGVRADVGVG